MKARIPLSEILNHLNKKLGRKVKPHELTNELNGIGLVQLAQELEKNKKRAA